MINRINSERSLEQLMIKQQSRRGITIFLAFFCYHLFCIVGFGNCMAYNTQDGYGIELKGIRTHFWLEKTYSDLCGEERWQDEQLINLKLWYMTRWINLNQVKSEVPDILWTFLVRKVWVACAIGPTLEQLCQDPEGEAHIDLNTLLEVPIKFDCNGESRSFIDPELIIRIVPRGV